jgi:hypothetical protein
MTDSLTGMGGDGQTSLVRPIHHISSELFEPLCSTMGLERKEKVWCVEQLGTPRLRCDEHNSKFSLSYETKV